MSGKKISIRLPEEHSIWKYPTGRRSDVLRRWIEAGKMADKVDRRLSLIEKRIEILETKIDGISDKIQVIATSKTVREEEKS